MDEFVESWLRGVIHAADRRYYASEERRAMSPDPAQLIEQPTQSMMRSVLPEP